MNEIIQTLINNDNTIHETDMCLFKFDNRIVDGTSFFGTIHTLNVERLDRDKPIDNLIEYLTHNRHTVISKIRGEYIHKHEQEYYARVTTIRHW